MTPSDGMMADMPVRANLAIMASMVGVRRGGWPVAWPTPRLRRGRGEGPPRAHFLAGALQSHLIDRSSAVVFLLLLVSFPGRVPTAAEFALAVALFAASATLARWFPLRFRLGPVEWLRSRLDSLLAPSSRGSPG